MIYSFGGGLGEAAPPPKKLLLFRVGGEAANTEQQTGFGAEPQQRVVGRQPSGFGAEPQPHYQER
ncbi:hypothetical protein CJ255_16055 [Candidatus Viridilinea mediisalina]|uniref:Uncharacterized protein n=1 Tax=Candidatus Viridilinea mediisalina TaxID=2024553 RepID=A0A2A6RGN5_9CHLR|nr:hypothetical protein CJ255_16055 [Candidatus Viridilinea mediisalina]